MAETFRLRIYNKLPQILYCLVFAPCFCCPCLVWNLILRFLFFHGGRWTPQSCRAKQTHLPSVKLTWHLKDGGWESFLLGWWLVARAIFTYVILLLVQKSQTTTRGCIKPCKEWDKLPFPQLVIAGFLPSTVCWFLSGSIIP